MRAATPLVQVLLLWVQLMAVASTTTKIAQAPSRQSALDLLATAAMAAAALASNVPRFGLEPLLLPTLVFLLSCVAGTCAGSCTSPLPPPWRTKSDSFSLTFAWSKRQQYFFIAGYASKVNRAWRSNPALWQISNKPRKTINWLF
jgi:hypothetical protein